VEPVTKVRSFLKTEKVQKEIACPDVVCVYNHHMGGIDLQDFTGNVCNEIEKQEIVLQNFLPHVRL